LGEKEVERVIAVATTRREIGVGGMPVALVSICLSSSEGWKPSPEKIKKTWWSSLASTGIKY